MLDADLGGDEGSVVCLVLTLSPVPMGITVTLLHPGLSAGTAPEMLLLALTSHNVPYGKWPESHQVATGSWWNMGQRDEGKAASPITAP